MPQRDRLVPAPIIASAILRELGFDPTWVTKVEITLTSSEAPLIVITKLLPERDGQALTEVVRRYRLQARELVD
jgi:hypothetical protein